MNWLAKRWQRERNQKGGHKRSHKRSQARRKQPSAMRAQAPQIVRAAAGISALLLLLWGGNALLSMDMPQLMPLQQVTVSGELHHLQADSLQQLISEQIDGGYFSVDLAQIRTALLRQPWIREVSLRRQWPAALLVHIEEQQPLAYWNADAYINQDGEVFRPARIDRSLVLPVLQGPAGQHEKVWRFMNRLYRELAALDYRVQRLQLDARRAWQMQIQLPGDGEAVMQVRLGRYDTERRLARFLRAVPVLMQQQLAVAAIDMRYPNGFAVRMQAAPVADRIEPAVSTLPAGAAETASKRTTVRQTEV